MIDLAALDVADPEEATRQRDDLVERIRDHAGTIAYQLAKFQGGDYGQQSFETDRGTWTVKYEAGDLQYLRFEGGRGLEVYVVSTKQPPEPEKLATALEDYEAFVASYNEYVRSLDGLLDDVDPEYPEIETTEGVVAERDRLLNRVEEACDLIAGELHRYEGGDYGTFTTRVDGTRWELKWDTDGVSYLRAGGSGGVYLLSQYEPPSAADVRKYAPMVAGVIEAYNEHVAELESDLATVSL